VAVAKAVEAAKQVVQVLPRSRQRHKAVEAVRKLLRQRPHQAAEPARKPSQLSQASS